MASVRACGVQCVWPFGCLPAWCLLPGVWCLVSVTELPTARVPFGILLCRFLLAGFCLPFKLCFLIVRQSPATFSCHALVYFLSSHLVPMLACSTSSRPTTCYESEFGFLTLLTNLTRLLTIDFPTDSSIIVRSRPAANICVLFQCSLNVVAFVSRALPASRPRVHRCVPLQGHGPGLCSAACVFSSRTSSTW